MGKPGETCRRLSKNFGTGKQGNRLKLSQERIAQSKVGIVPCARRPEQLQCPPLPQSQARGRIICAVASQPLQLRQLVASGFEKRFVRTGSAELVYCGWREGPNGCEGRHAASELLGCVGDTLSGGDGACPNNARVILDCSAKNLATCDRAPVCFHCIDTDLLRLAGAQRLPSWLPNSSRESCDKL